MSTKRILTTAAVVAVLGVLIYFQVQHWRSFDWARFRSASRVHPLHVAAAIALIYITYVLRALRWKIFLEPVCKTRTARLVAPTFIGFTGLALLGRPGEFIRPYLIARKEGLSFTSQVGAWTVERIFDVGAFTVLMTLDVFLSSSIRGSPYIGKFRWFAVVLSVGVGGAGALALLIRKYGPEIGLLVRKLGAKWPRMALILEHKASAFGEGLNTVSGWGSFAKLVGISLLMWSMIAVAYREVAHSYGREAGQEGPPVVDVKTANEISSPTVAGEPLTPETLEAINAAAGDKRYEIRFLKGQFWLYKDHHRQWKVGDRPHLADMDIQHVLILMGFSMVGSIVQLPGVGGGSQLAVIGALQVVYGIPPENALSCGILLWLVTFMSCIPLGLILAHRAHLSLRKLSKASHETPQLAES